MENMLVRIIHWLFGNWGWIVGGLCVFFEISPKIKINPISFVCKWIGDKLTAGIKKDINDMRKNSEGRYAELKSENENIRYAIDMQRIANIKATILDFANSCRNGRKHSKEEFAYVLSENDEYERIIKKYNIINNVYKEDFAYIKEIYHECLRENKFLA